MNGLAAVLSGGVALVAAALSVTRPSAVHALLYLVASLLALAAAFFALGASFAGVLQVLIYAGAIVVVFVFVVMTLDPSPAALTRERAALARAWQGPGAMALALLAPFLFGIGSGARNEAGPTPVPVQALGRLLFGSWAVVVELASFLLLAGLIGVRHLGRRAGRRDRLARGRP